MIGLRGAVGGDRDRKKEGEGEGEGVKGCEDWGCG